MRKDYNIKVREIREIFFLFIYIFLRGDNIALELR